MSPARVGVLAVQGGVREHADLLSGLGADVVLVRRPTQLEDLDALVLPGGESSTIDRLTRILGLREPLRAAIGEGLPTLGTCAGLILLAETVVDPAPDQQSLGALPVTVRRNAFGRQVDSSEEEIATTLGPVRAAFIRAPQVVEAGEGVEVIARRGGDVEDPSAPIVGVRAGSLLGISFHPELTGDPTIHRALLALA
ncbi:pyridoxal 5'-phosphate synthase glutaminase subunit PdxT [Brachybacterium huguangmaarense]